MLNVAGMAVGQDPSLAAPRSFNQAGIWEHSGFSDINRRILRRLGCNTNIPPSLYLPSSWADKPQFDALMHDARRLIELEFSGAEFWGWKDPKTTLVLPFWQRLIPNLECIIALRNPVEMAASFSKESGYSLQRCLVICFLYTVSALWHTRDRRRLIVFYEDLIERFDQECVRILRFLSRRLPPGIETEILGVLRPELRHHSLAINTMLSDSMIPWYVKTLYYSLHILAGSEVSAGEGPNDSAVQVQKSLSDLSSVLYEAFCKSQPLLSRGWSRIALAASLRTRGGAAFYQFNRLAEVLAQEGSREFCRDAVRRIAS
jgi:hypothetical protein